MIIGPWTNAEDAAGSPVTRTTMAASNEQHLIKRLRPAVVGVFADLACPNCGSEREVYLATIMGITLGSHECPACSAVQTIAPEDFASALDRLWPEPPVEEIVALTNEATRVTELWHRHEPFTSALRYRDVNLGEAAERFLLADVTLGLLHATRGEGQS